MEKSLKIEEIVEFAVRETFSVVKSGIESEVTINQLFDEMKEKISEKFDVSEKRADKLYKPVYWSLVNPDKSPKDGCPFYLNNNEKEYLAVKGDVDLNVSEYSDKIIEEHGETLNSRFNQ